MKKNQTWTNEELIDKLVQHDATALRCLYEVHAKDLLNYFILRYNSLSKEEISDAITDALIKLVDNPAAFKPGSSSLKTYLIRDIKGDILNTLAKIQRAKKKLSVVELSDDDGNIKEESTNEVKDLELKVQNFLAKILDNERDIQLAWMMEIDRERATSEFVRVLQKTQLPPAEQKAEVKKHKDRIKKRLNRNGWEDFLKKLKQNV